MVGTVDEALELRKRGVVQTCMGEVRGRKAAGFDFGNSPFEIINVRFGGQTVAQRTSAGTQGIVKAIDADRLYATSFVTATATARALVTDSPGRISLVAMGHEGVARTDEDELCALHIRNLLEGRSGDVEAVRRVILAAGEAVRFRDPEKPHSPAEDLDIALDIDRFDFAVRVRQEDGLLLARVEKHS